MQISTIEDYTRGSIVLVAWFVYSSCEQSTIHRVYSCESINCEVLKTLQIAINRYLELGIKTRHTVIVSHYSVTRTCMQALEGREKAIRTCTNSLIDY